MKKLIGWSGVVLGLAFFMPVVALAQNASRCSQFAIGGGSRDIRDIICRVGNIIDLIIPLLILLAVLFFIWGVIQYVINTDDEEAKTKGRDRMIAGLVGFAVIFAMWGLVRIVQNTFGVQSGEVTPQIPQVPF